MSFADRATLAPRTYFTSLTEETPDQRLARWRSTFAKRYREEFGRDPVLDRALAESEEQWKLDNLLYDFWVDSEIATNDRERQRILTEFYS